MLGILVLLIIASWLCFLYPIFRRKTAETPHSGRYEVQMKKLWSAAQTSMRDHKPLRAEKALLTILKFDEKNAAAYNRLGILYAKEQKFNEAIECFEIAQSLDNNPSSFHNVGLIYLETGAYEKAAMAFEQAINLENTIPARFIALAKARERLGQTKGALDALESAYELDHSVNTLRQILAIHEKSGDMEALADITARIESQIAEDAAFKAQPRRNPRRAVTRQVPTAGQSARNTRGIAGSSTGGVARNTAGGTARGISSGATRNAGRIQAGRGSANTRSLKTTSRKAIPAGNHSGVTVRSTGARPTSGARVSTPSRPGRKI